MYKLKNGYTIRKEGVYNGYEEEYRWFLYNPAGKLTFSYGSLEKAREAAYKMCDWHGTIESEFPTEEAADKWIKENKYTEYMMRSKHFEPSKGKWIVTWVYYDKDIDYDDLYPERPIEL